MCDEAKCQKETLPREEYNITKAVRCDIECCSEDRCNDGKLTAIALAEVTSELSKAEVPFISCLYVMALALASFILGNN